MTGRVIQGLFLGAQPKLAAVQPRTAPPSIQAKTMARLPGPPATAFAVRAPGPPAPAFSGRPPAAPGTAGQQGTVQRHGAGGAFGVDAGPLGLLSTGGRPLPEAVRGKMEAALGADFSSVRVHVGPQAERIGAIAFTVGSDIYFAPGRYQPDSIQGQQLLGHELTHVVQQRAGRVRNPLGSGLAVVQDHALEAEADRMGQRAAMHRVAAQAKLAPGVAQPSPPVRISPPVSAGSGSYRLSAGSGGREIGSVMVHARERGAVEVTDLGVDAAQRGNGVGRMLVVAAARTGLQSGRSKVTLAAQDRGSGHLTRWYKEMGFTQTGATRNGYPQLEAPISQVIARTAQRQITGTFNSAASPGNTPHSSPRGPIEWGRIRPDAMTGPFAAVRQYDQGARSSSMGVGLRRPGAHLSASMLQRMEDQTYQRPSKQDFSFKTIFPETPTLGQLAEPKVVDLPEWITKNNQRLEEALERIFDNESQVDLGTFVLPLDGKTRSATLEDPAKHPPMFDENANGFSKIQTNESLKNAIVQVAIDGLKYSGQLQYIRHALKIQKNTEQRWVGKINVHYYRKRSKEQIGLHKDGRADVPFFSLFYLNKDPIIGPEVVFNPPKLENADLWVYDADENPQHAGKFNHEQFMIEHMPPSMHEEFKRLRDSEPGSEIRETTVPKHGMASIMNNLAHHGTPLRDNRNADTAEVYEYLTVYHPGHNAQVSVALGEPEKRTFTRRLSQENIRRGMPRDDPSAPRRFFRVWIRTVPEG